MLRCALGIIVNISYSNQRYDFFTGIIYKEKILVYGLKYFRSLLSRKSGQVGL